MENIFQEMTLERDHQELSLGDAIDVKAGILLAVIAVLATLSGILFAIPKLLSEEGEVVQLASIMCLAVACVFAVLTVLPRDYFIAELPRKYEAWGDTLRQYYGSDAERQAAIASGIVEQASKRIEKNQKINLKKSQLLSRSFWPVLIALAIDVCTLFVLGLVRVLS